MMYKFIEIAPFLDFVRYWEPNFMIGQFDTRIHHQNVMSKFKIIFYFFFVSYNNDDIYHKRVTLNYEFDGLSIRYWGISPYIGDQSLPKF